MSIPNATISALPVRTPALLLAAVEEAIVNVLLGNQNVSINGVAFGRADLDKLRDMRTELLDEVEATAAASTGGGIALVKYGERV